MWGQRLLGSRLCVRYTAPPCTRCALGTWAGWLLGCLGWPPCLRQEGAPVKTPCVRVCAVRHLLRLLLLVCAVGTTGCGRCCVHTVLLLMCEW